jgi:hypothetical protein
MNRFLAALAAVAGFLGANALAQSPADRTAIQSVISGQIDAFRLDDAHAAFAAASPGIQSKFLNAEIFMGMVAGGYAPVYRPRSFAFGPLAATGGGPLQRVFVVGPDGQAYIADYLMEREGDGSWRIDGVSIERDTQPSI